MIFINGNVPSSKNSKQFVTFKTGKKMLISSKTVRNYIKNHCDEWWKNTGKFKEMIKEKEKPYKIGFYLSGTVKENSITLMQHNFRWI